MQIPAPRSWRMFLPLAGVLLLALIWSIYWFMASGLVQERVLAERAKLAANGMTLACSSEDWGGYPFHFELTCTQPVLTRAGVGRIASAKLLMTALAYAPWQLVALVDGPSSLAPTNADSSTMFHQRAMATVTFDRDWRPRLSLEVPEISIPDQGTAENVRLHTRPSASGGTDIALSAVKVAYRPADRPPFMIGKGELLAKLTTVNALEIERILLEQGSVRYWGAGTLGLDEANRPFGKLDTETNDLDGLLEILDPHLNMKDGEKSGLKTMLGLLGNEAKAALILKDGVIYLGPFRIADLRPLY